MIEVVEAQRRGRPHKIPQLQSLQTKPDLMVNSSLVDESGRSINGDVSKANIFQVGHASCDVTALLSLNSISLQRNSHHALDFLNTDKNRARKGNDYSQVAALSRPLNMKLFLRTKLPISSVAETAAHKINSVGSGNSPTGAPRSPLSDFSKYDSKLREEQPRLKKNFLISLPAPHSDLQTGKGDVELGSNLGL